MSRLMRSISLPKMPSNVLIFSGVRCGPMPGRSRTGTAPDTSRSSTSVKMSTVPGWSAAYSFAASRCMSGLLVESVSRLSLIGTSSLMIFSMPYRIPSRRAEQREELAAGNHQVDRVDGDLGKALGQRDQLDPAAGHLGHLPFAGAWPG